MESVLDELTAAGWKRKEIKFHSFQICPFPHSELKEQGTKKLGREPMSWGSEFIVYIIVTFLTNTTINK